MAILGTLLKKGIKIRESLDQEYSSHFDLQKQELKKLLLTANSTEFGKFHKFTEILEGYKSPASHDFYERLKKNIPTFDYNSIFEKWWKRSLNSEMNICWPGKIKYFALSSGTSESSSKHIPITKEMAAAIRKTSARQIMSLSKYDLPDHLFETGILMLGGSTHLNYNGRYFTGDLSGITTSQLPFWFQHFYKPGRKIAMTRNWDAKLNEITEKAPHWDIGVIVGVPAWIQILIEKIVAHYKVDSIHDIWPNLSIYVHGGVSFDPYKKGFEKLLGKPLHYIETYLASEGFIAFQSRPNQLCMRMVLNNGIFYEFVPFDKNNFTPDGKMVPNPESCMIDQVEEGKEYALLISSCAGAWRYLIGDVIRFVSKKDAEIVITGRTKHFLSLCGEHLSIDNMNKAISIVSEELNIDIKEFTVAGIPYKSLFAHQWFIGSNDNVESCRLKERIDEILMELNDDYRVERTAALKEIFLDIIPVKYFYQWLEKHDKVGGQNKFPRVMKATQLKDWQHYLSNLKVPIIS
jgi:hypothetical protein